MPLATVPAGDLNTDRTRKRMREQKWNLFGPTCAGHTLEAYRRLPEGWRPGPQGIWSDLHMWRQWLAQPWCRFHSEPALTTLHFPSSTRQNRTMEERVEELETWWHKCRQPGFLNWLERERLRDWQRCCENPDFYFQLAKTMAVHAEWEMAEEFFRHAVDTNPTVSGYFKYLSDVLIKREAWEEAVSSAKSAVELEPENPNLWHHLGYVCAGAQRWEEAVAALAEAIGIDSSVAEYYYSMSVYLEQLVRLEEASEHALTAAKLDPDEPRFQQRLERLRGTTQRRSTPHNNRYQT